MSTLDIPVPGPCSTDDWVTVEDVANCIGEECDNPSIFQTAATEAAVALYEISGRVFPGTCTRRVRPCSDRCGCWGAPSSGIGPWYWTSASYGVAPSGWFWGWRSECSPNPCGCGTLSRVKLAGYPVIEIIEVLIDGEPLDPLDENGNPNYRLDHRRWLTRMDDPTDETGNPRLWPACQNLALDSDQPGTFEITYTWGIGPPQIAKDAAAELAVEIFRACSNQSCQLPTNTVRVQRLGVTVERNVLLAFLDPTKPTGLVALDIFLAQNYGQKYGRRSAVWSPDVPQFAQKLG